MPCSGVGVHVFVAVERAQKDGTTAVAGPSRQRVVFLRLLMPVKLLLEVELADVALVVRKVTDKVDAGYIDSLINMIKAPDGSNRRSTRPEPVQTEAMYTVGSWFKLQTVQPQLDWFN